MLYIHLQLKILMIILAAVRSYLKSDKIAEFENLKSKEDQITFLLHNKTQNSLLQVGFESNLIPVTIFSLTSNVLNKCVKPIIK